MSRYVKAFKVKHRDKDKNSKLMSFRTDHEKLLGKFKTIWTKTEDLKKYSIQCINILLQYI